MESRERICYGCMSIIPNTAKVCPYCGFEESAYVPSPRCLKPGTVLHDNYIVGKVIGEGGFGITYIGWNCHTETPVSIKEYFPLNIASRDCSNNDNSIYCFDDKEDSAYQTGFNKYVREAQTLKKFNHLDGIVSIQDFFEENNTAYIVMEYIEGITLKEYLATNGTLSPKETFELMMPVMSALEHIHKEGIIHRDISPDNIMIRMDGAFKLIDFGAARLTNIGENQNLTIILKRGFAPEEQYRSKGKQGPWTDIYALCATMYKMMTNIIPPESMDRLVDDELVPLEKFQLNITPKQIHAIEKGLRVKAKDRYQNMKDLRLDLSSEAEKDPKLSMIATFRTESGNIKAYRLFDRFHGTTYDYRPEDIISGIQNNVLQVDNLIVYQNYIQPVGGNIAHYPILDDTGNLLQNDHLYYVEHTLSSGFLCLNYKGEALYFNEEQIQEKLQNGCIANSDKVQMFLSLRSKQTKKQATQTQQTTFTTSTTKTVSPKNATVKADKNTEPPKPKLRLRTSESSIKHNNTLQHDVTTQLRLKMQNQNNLHSQDKKDKKWRGF